MDTISADVIVHELLTQLNLTDFIHVNQLNHKYNTYCQNQFIWKNRYQCDIFKTFYDSYIYQSHSRNDHSPWSI